MRGECGLPEWGALDGGRDLITVLRKRASEPADHPAFIFLTDGETDEFRLSYADLDLAATRIAVSLQRIAVRGDRALLLYPPGPDFICAFFGCLYAGVVGIPLYPPRPNRTLERIERVIDDSGASLALTVERTLSDLASQWGDNARLSSVEYVPTDTIRDGVPAGWQPATVSGDDLAYLQYTSGSTSAPRGVMVTHGNLAYNCAYMRDAFSLSPETRSVTWLPHFHDMGLIEGLLDPIYTGFPAVVMSPTHFVQKPLRWLQAISRYRATHSGAPNFAFDLCARKVTVAEAAELDLSSWTLAYSGAEPVRAETLERFAEFFAPTGFRRESLYPCYGLAEATLMVSGGDKQHGPILLQVDPVMFEQGRILPAADQDGKSRTAIGCGHARHQTTIAIVDPLTRMPCPLDTVGEIWVSGPTVAAGYWQHTDSGETFDAHLADGTGPYLRTGDLGIVRDGELFITGRSKDLIIIRGANFYPQDIEWIAENAHEALRKGFGAVFSIERDGQEQLVVAQEIERQYRKMSAAELDGVAGVVRGAIADEFDLTTTSVVLLAFGTINKTSSGKIQRHACREDYLAGHLDMLWESKLAEADELVTPATTSQSPRARLLAARPGERRRLLEGYLSEHLAALLGIAPRRIDPRKPLGSYGLDSLRGNELVCRLQTELAIPLSNTLVWNHPTIADVATHIANKMQINLEAEPLTGVAVNRSRADQLASSAGDDAGDDSEAMLYELLADECDPGKAP